MSLKSLYDLFFSVEHKRRLFVGGMLVIKEFRFHTMQVNWNQNYLVTNILHATEVGHTSSEEHKGA